MALLFSLVNKIWTAITTFLIGICFVLPLFSLACITTTAATVFLVLLITAKSLSDGCHRLTQWWFSADDSRLEFVPSQRPRNNNNVSQDNDVRVSRHGSGAGSQSSNGTPSRSNRSNSDASLSSMPNPNRDYEGVGGWKTDLTESDQAIFLNMNSGIELGSPSRRRRSFGASSVISSGINSPELINTPFYGRSNASGSLRRMSGTGSPQSYFSVPVGGSMVTINSRRSSRVLYNNDRVRVEKENGDGTEDENAVV